MSEIKPGAFNGLGKLKTLELGWNVLTRIDEDMWEGLSSLEVLYLTLNPISHLAPGAFRVYPNSKHLG